MMAMVLLGAADATAATFAGVVGEGVGVLICVPVDVPLGNGVKVGLELARTPPVIVVVQDGVPEAVPVSVRVPLGVAPGRDRVAVVVVVGEGDPTARDGVIVAVGEAAARERVAVVVGDGVPRARERVAVSVALGDPTARDRVAVSVAEGDPTARDRVAVSVGDGVPRARDRVAVSVADGEPTTRERVGVGEPTARERVAVSVALGDPTARERVADRENSWVWEAVGDTLPSPPVPPGLDRTRDVAEGLSVPTGICDVPVVKNDANKTIRLSIVILFLGYTSFHIEKLYSSVFATTF
jgi:hypothetical protein